MSHAEIKAFADRLNDEERVFLAAYLMRLSAKEYDKRKEAWFNAMHEMDDGVKVSHQTLKSMHDELERSGL